MIEWTSVSEATPTPNELIIVEYEYGYEIGALQTIDLGDGYTAYHYMDRDCNKMNRVKNWCYIENP